MSGENGQSRGPDPYALAQIAAAAARQAEAEARGRAEGEAQSAAAARAAQVQAQAQHSADANRTVGIEKGQKDTTKDKSAGRTPQDGEQKNKPDIRVKYGEYNRDSSQNGTPYGPYYYKEKGEEDLNSYGDFLDWFQAFQTPKNAYDYYPVIKNEDEYYIMQQKNTGTAIYGLYFYIIQ